MICPDCQGSKETIASHVRYANGQHGYNVTMNCLRCQGSGEVDDRMLEWIRRGKIMRDKRVNGIPFRSLYEEAKRLGIDIATLSKMECGKIEPKDTP